MKKIFKNNLILSICVLSSLLVAIYWSFVASDIYISKANVVLETPSVSIGESVSFQSLLSGSSNKNSDMLMLKEYILSVDMMKKVEEEFGFRKHYSNKNIDYFSRLKHEAGTIEEDHEYYKKRISVNLDDYSQVLRIEVEGFEPEYAYKIANFIIKNGEHKINSLGQVLAEEQVEFLEKQVFALNKKMENARSDLLAYQNIHGLVSPIGAINNINTIIVGLESTLSNLEAELKALMTYQSSKSSKVIFLKDKILALSEQINLEKNKIVKDNQNALNFISSEYQNLELKFNFSRDTYGAALVALESTRIESVRKLKQLYVLQTPTYPEYPIKPMRLYNTFMYILVTLLFYFIVKMLLMIIKDHND